MADTDVSRSDGNTNVSRHIDEHRVGALTLSLRQAVDADILPSTILLQAINLERQFLVFHTYRAQFLPNVLNNSLRTFAASTAEVIATVISTSLSPAESLLSPG